MAYIVGKLVEYQASGASFTPNFSNIIWDTRLSTANRAILADDLILTCIANRQPVGTTLNAATGYTALGTYGRQSNQASRWFYKKATGGETGVAYTVENQDCIGHTLIIRGCETTPTIAIGSRKDWTNSASVTPSGAELPTATAGDLVIHSISSNNTSCFSRTKINEATALTRYDASNVALAVAYKQVESAGTVSAAVWYNRVATNGGNAWVLSIKSATGAAYQPDVRTNITETNWYGLHGAVNTLVPTTNAWTKPSTFNGSGTLNGINLSTIALGTVSTSTQLYPTVVGTFSGIPHATNEAAWAGAWHTVSSEDMTGKLFALQWGMDVAASNAAVGAGGVIVVFSDGTDWVAYQLASKAKGWGANSPETAVIAIGAATPYRSSSDEGGGAINWGAVTRYAYFWHRVSSASTFNLFVRNALTIATQSATTPAYGAHLTGGGSAFPATPGDFFSALTSYEFTALCARQAEGQVMSRIDLIFGDGTNKTYVDASAVPVSFPQAWSASDTGNWQMNWNVPTLKLYYGVNTSVNDTINLTADAFVAPNKQHMVIDAASNTGAAVSIAGSSIVGTTFMDNAGFALTSGTFKNGGTVSLKASATSLSVSNTVGAVPAVSMTANSKTLTSCTIDVTGTSATYHLETAAAVTAITLADVTFTGIPATDKVHVLATTGTVTITITGTTSLVAGDVTSAGATVVIAAPQPTLSATVLANSRVVLYNNTTDAELDNTAPAGTSWSKVITSGASANDSLTLYAFKEGYQEFSTTFLYTGEDQTILVTQEVDSNIASLRTELSITDYTTITEFSLDITGTVEIDADDADGSTTKARLAIWYNGVLTTENGARYLRGAITILSTAAFRINTSILDLKIENISATYGLNFTDTERRLYRDDGAPIYAAASAPGSIQNDYSGVPDTVETGVSGLTGSESAQLMSLPSAATITAAVWAYVITGSTTAVQMMRGFAAVLLGKVSGAGTGTETFRDIADTTDVVVATVDSDGNRTAIIRTLT